MKRTFLVIGLVLASTGIVGVATYADHDEDEQVEELMEKTHEGKRSAYRQVKKEAEARAPSWRLIEATLPRVEEMSRALRESKNDDIRDSADGYLDAVKEIVLATKNRDAKAVRDAVESLTQACGDCHFKGGVGGELDD